MSTAPRRIIRGVPQTPPQTLPLVAESKMGEDRRHIIQRIPSQRERPPTLVCGSTGPVASHSDSNNDFSFAGTGQSSSERFIILAPLRNRRTPAIVLPKQYEGESNSRSQPKSESAQGRKPVRTEQNICDGMLGYSGDARSSCQPCRPPVPNVNRT